MKSLNKFELLFPATFFCWLGVMGDRALYSGLEKLLEKIVPSFQVFFKVLTDFPTNFEQQETSEEL